MLFHLKRRLDTALILTFTLGVAGILLQPALNLSWDLRWQDDTLRSIIIAFVILLIGDAVLQGAYRLIYREHFHERNQEFLQTTVVGESSVIFIVALTAATEELFFRGVLIEMIVGVGWGPLPAILLSSYLFNLAHLIQKRNIAIFLGASIWEGLVMGITYVITGSLLVVMILHAIHDLLMGGAAIMVLEQTEQESAFGA